jgi:hypothetical protein
MGTGERPRARTVWKGTLVVAVIVLLSVGFLLIPEMPPTTVTCSTPDTLACTNTRNWISDHWGQDFVFGEPLPAHLVSVDVRQTPPEWTRLGIARTGDWAALLTMAGREPVLVACYYSSEEMVACDDP